MLDGRNAHKIKIRRHFVTHNQTDMKIFCKHMLPFPVFRFILPFNTNGSQAVFFYPYHTHYFNENMCKHYIFI